MSKPDTKWPVKWFPNRQCWMIEVGIINPSKVQEPNSHGWVIRDEVSQWFVANGLEGRPTGPDWSWGPVTDHTDGVAFYFRDEVKALLFKLTWGGL